MATDNLEHLSQPDSQGFVLPAADLIVPRKSQEQIIKEVAAKETLDRAAEIQAKADEAQMQAEREKLGLSPNEKEAEDLVAKMDAAEKLTQEEKEANDADAVSAYEFATQGTPEQIAAEAAAEKARKDSLRLTEENSGISLKSEIGPELNADKMAAEKAAAERAVAETERQKAEAKAQEAAEKEAAEKEAVRTAVAEKVVAEREAKRIAAEKAAEERKAQKVAKENLLEIAGKMTGKNRQETEALFPAAETSYRMLTGEKLRDTARAKAEEEVRASGGKIITIAEWRAQEPGRIKAEEDKQKNIERESGIMAAFNRLSPEELKTYREPDGTIDMEAFRKSLAEKCKQSEIPENVFYYLSKNGFAPENTTVEAKSGWRKVTEKIEIPSTVAGASFIFTSREAFDKYIQENSKRIDDERNAGAKKEVNAVLLKGQRSLREKVYRHEKAIIEARAVELGVVEESAKAPRREQGKEKNPLAEIVSEIGAEDAEQNKEAGWFAKRAFPILRGWGKKFKGNKLIASIAGKLVEGLNLGADAFEAGFDVLEEARDSKKRKKLAEREAARKAKEKARAKNKARRNK